MTTWLIGFACSLAVSGAAYWKHALSRSGAMAAVVMGTVYYAAGSLVWFGTLLAFFISSTLLSKWKKRKKERYEAAYEKTGRRDAGQVLANGGIGMLLCVVYALFPHPGWLFAFIGVMATVNADTWATEVGSLSRARPRSVLTWKPIPTGTSGGISALGTAASVLGGIWIGTIADALIWLEYGDAFRLSFVYAGAIAGTCGAFADSLLGAACQAMFRCETCGRTVERRNHCGRPTVLVRGARWLNNDLVNAVSSCLGGLIGFVCGVLI
ncbi:DUF92 domain-containing protein [Paenibacillus sp. MSJ-34]|uniref:DUF92 domain-containing protein n=1 Tax=Paenibacillus sp. MSJ-34 TaxID=2841529 RepID=UPI001C0F87E7|nr:DUF92 domain-containing protein [Paenibacillus sp. MSJ-34]MBU5442067.1 DUF92 domain-containing protein [Paenibacillus sp. MSJ-34]